VKRSLRRYLRRRGASDEEIERATHAGYLALLVFDRAIMPGERRYTMAELAARAGADLVTARTIWRAIGFPDVQDDLPAFSDTDVAALRGLVERLRDPWLMEWTLERALPQARVMSSALARIAEAASDDFAHSLALAREAGLGDEEVAGLLVERFDYHDVARLLDHTFRLQLRAAMWRRLVGGDLETPGTVTGAVGFVDLVGYTALAQDLEDEELAALVGHFGDLAHDTVVGEGGRIVKTIGDEVMYVSDTPGAAAAIALRLAERSTGDAALPEVRAGLAYGALVARDGDYFGPVVNLASRLTALARPGEVLMSADMAAALGGDPRVRARRTLPKRIRDIGRVDVYRLERA
jgi:adenylate cyclase